MSSTFAVLVATRNREPQLARMLDGLARLELSPELTCQVHIVDNGQPQDAGTPGIALLANNIEVHRHYLQEAGKSKALNLAMEKAQADFLAFIDDDVIVSPTWLKELYEGFGACRADVLQGGVELILPEPAPWWLTPRVQAICAATSLWREEAPVRELNGSNMAVRWSPELPRFCEQIGPGKPPFAMGEDVEWSRRLLGGGKRARYWPRALVYHDLDQRLRLQEVLYRQVHGGWNQLVFAEPGCRFRLLLRAYFQFFYSLAKLAVRGLLGARFKGLDHLLDAARHFGVIQAPWIGIQNHPLWRREDLCLEHSVPPFSRGLDSDSGARPN